jgi:hypothetical protein
MIHTKHLYMLSACLDVTATAKSDVHVVGTLRISAGTAFSHASTAVGFLQSNPT